MFPKGANYCNQRYQKSYVPVTSKLFLFVLTPRCFLKLIIGGFQPSHPTMGINTQGLNRHRKDDLIPGQPTLINVRTKVLRCRIPNQGHIPFFKTRECTHNGKHAIEYGCANERNK